MISQMTLPTNKILPGQNDRTTFAPEGLHELASSIKAFGLAQPIVVRPVDRCTECAELYSQSDRPDFCPKCGGDAFESLYQIVAGERRFRAVTQILGFETISAIVRPLTDEQASAIMLVENVSRTDLDPIDEGQAYRRRMAEFGWSVADCAQNAGVSAVRVRFRIKILSLRPELQCLIRNGHMPIGYAQVLADGNLDVNRQLIALGELRDNPSPTPAWFRKIVAKLVTEQDQEALFDDSPFRAPAQESEKAIVSEPAHPLTTTPPVVGATPREIVAGQISFWRKAAQDWDAMGKPFRRQECETAAQALAFTLAAI